MESKFQVAPWRLVPANTGDNYHASRSRTISPPASSPRSIARWHEAPADVKRARGAERRPRGWDAAVRNRDYPLRLSAAHASAVSASFLRLGVIGRRPAAARRRETRSPRREARPRLGRAEPKLRLLAVSSPPRVTARPLIPSPSAAPSRD